MVVDANLGSLKSDPHINRTIDYSIEEINNEFIAKLDITYKNNASFGWKTTRYRTYTRVYVPKNTQLISYNGLMDNDRTTKKGIIDEYNEFGKTVFGGFIAIEPKQTGTISFVYKLPKKIIAENEYSLYIQKQPGNSKTTINLDFDFDKNIKNIETLPFSVINNNLKYTTNTKFDQELTIPFQ